MEEIDTIKVLENSGFLVEKDADIVRLSKKFRNPVNFPSHIIIDENFLRAIYLFWGDGSYTQKIHFTNKEPELHNYIIEMFEKYLGINKSVWRLRIIYNQIEGQEAENIKLKWLEKLGFSKEQLYPKIAMSGYKTNSEGNGRIIIDKITYADFIRSSLLYLNRLIESKVLNEKQLVSILDGILNAEGSALIDSIGLHRVVITLNKKEIMLVRNILSQLDIDEIFIESSQGKLVVSGWRRLYKFIKIFVRNDIHPFSVHIDRRKNIINGFLSHKRTIALYRYLCIIEKNEGLTMKRLARLANRDPASAKVVIIERMKEFTKVSGGGNPGKWYKIQLSDEGKEFLYVVRKLQNWEVKYEKRMANQDL